MNVLFVISRSDMTPGIKDRTSVVGWILLFILIALLAIFLVMGLKPDNRLDTFRDITTQTLKHF